MSLLGKLPNPSYSRKLLSKDFTSAGPNAFKSGTLKFRRYFLGEVHKSGTNITNLLGHENWKAYPLRTFSWCVDDP